MGLFDTIYASSDVAAAWRLRCQACGSPADPEHDWQTKSLECEMATYALRHDDRGAIRLYWLDPPSDRHLWRAWTADEIAESECATASGGFADLWRKVAGEGCYLPEAFLPKNRHHRFMGELPHQWIEIHGSCECGAFPRYWIRFTDGVATAIQVEPPQRPPGLVTDWFGS